MISYGLSNNFLASLSRPIDVFENAPNFSDVRIKQPYSLLQKLGWDIKIHSLPFDLGNSVRSGSLIIWQKPIAHSKDVWEATMRFLRKRQCMVIVEWDDHPDLFPGSIRERFKASDYWNLRYCHALQTSSSVLASVLKIYNKNTFVVENAVNPLPLIDLEKHDSFYSRRVFLGNFNRHEENISISRALRDWLESEDSLTLVVIAQHGFDKTLFGERVEWHEPMPYEEYRKLLATCQVALLPLCFGLPQSCKTPIKWMEAAAESTAVVAGPELYGPWLGEGRYGLVVQSLDQVVPMARWLMSQSATRKSLVKQAYARVCELELHRQLPWRMELYHHLDSLSGVLELSLNEKFPI